LVSYWTDIFTLETWAQAEQHGFQTTGFPPPTAGRGGYSVRLFERVSPGDILLCYCKRPAARWVGALRVRSDAFVGDAPIWGLDENGDIRYPWRFQVEPLVALDVLRGVPGDEAAARLGVLRELKQWGTYLQRSLNSVPDADGDALMELLRAPRAPLPIPLAATRKARRRADAPAATPIDATAVAPQLNLAVVEPDVDSTTEPRTHMEIEGKLRDIGLFEGFDVWVADRGHEFNGEPLGTGTLAELPVVAGERTRTVMRNIDVIWFRRGTGHPERFFEIEHSTSVYSGLLRFNDVMIDFPIPEAFIVGEDDRTMRKFEREIARRTFENSGLAGVTKFVAYDQIRKTWDRYRNLGSGSRDWSNPARAPYEESA
jgi:hypothetical protein